MKNRKIWILGFLFLILCGCKVQNDQYESVYEKYDEVPIIHIDIPDTAITLTSKDFEYIKALQNADYNTGMGYWPSLIGDSLYLVTDKHTKIKSIDINTGKLLDRYSFLGRGPGEYQQIGWFHVSKRYIFIGDGTLSKVIQYDRQWNHIRDIPLKGLNTIWFNSDIAYIDPNLMYPTGSDTNFSIRFRNLRENPSEYNGFHNRIISLGKKPRHYNDVWIDYAENGQILVANGSLPILFLYNENFELSKILRVHLPKLELITNSSKAKNASSRGVNYNNGNRNEILNPPPIEIETQKRIRMIVFVIDVLYTDDHIFLYFSNSEAGLRFLITLKKSNDKWVHHGNYSFLKENDEIFHVEHLMYSKPWLYISSHFEEHIIRLNINSL